MKQKMKRPTVKGRQEGYNGVLPSLAPLAYPYVPYQENDPPQYDARKGLIRGTMFPGLDLPLMGMVNQKEKPDTILTQLQTLDFAVTELALYLDTHREDREALELYRAYQQMYEKVRAQYQQSCGPLNHMRPEDGEYRWLDDPWPWEYCANQEG